MPLFTRTRKMTPAPATARSVSEQPGEDIAETVKAIAQGQASAAAEAIQSTERMRHYAQLILANPEEADTYRQMMQAEARSQAKMVNRQRKFVLTRMRLWARRDVRKRLDAAKEGAPLPRGLAAKMEQVAVKQHQPASPWDAIPEATILASWPE
jgi:ATP-dependent Lon protease